MAIYRGTGGSGNSNQDSYLNAVTAQAILATDAAAEAAADALETAADVVLTHADVVLTHADVVLAEADKVQTGIDRAAVAANLILTNADVVSAEADKVQTGLDRIATAADKVATNADVILAEADKVQTGLDRIATAADLVLTDADTIATAADRVVTTADKAATNADAATATTQAGIATTKASESSASATNAANSAAAAATALDSFDDRYLGAKTAAPTLDNDGLALVTGALYFDTTVSGMRVYDGSTWIAASSAGTASLLTYKYIATNAQTTFTGVDANGVTLVYTTANIIVLLNGIILDAADYTATSGTSVVLATGAATGDELVVVAFKSFTVADHYTKTQADALLAAKATVANFTSTGIDDNATATAVTVDASGNVGIGTSSPFSRLQVLDEARVSSASHSAGKLAFGDGGTGNDNVGIWRGAANSASDGNWLNLGAWGDSGITFSVGSAVFGSKAESMRIDSSGNVGIGITPSTNWSSNNVLQIGTKASFSSSPSFSGFATNLVATSSGWATKYTRAGAASAYLQATSDGSHIFYTAPVGSEGASASLAERMRIDSSGNLLVGTTSSVGAGSEGVELRGGAGYINTARNSTGFVGHIQFFNPNGVVGLISTSGSATSYNTSSDYRLKTNVLPMTGATATFMQLKPCNFEWISSGERVDGFLAHELQEVIPAAATGTKDAMRDEEYEVTPAVYDAEGVETTPAVMGTRSVPDMQGIDQSKVVPLLVATVQEALAEIETLKTRLTALEGV